VIVVLVKVVQIFTIPNSYFLAFAQISQPWVLELDLWRGLVVAGKEVPTSSKYPNQFGIGVNNIVFCIYVKDNKVDSLICMIATL
jgi:hypothetical protein